MVNDTGHLRPCFDSSRLVITWMSNINDVPMLVVLVSYFSRYEAFFPFLTLPTTLTFSKLIHRVN